MSSALKPKTTSKVKSNKPALAVSAPLNCVDLFAGAGGFSTAAINLGIRVKAAVEIDRHACSSYRANLVENKPTPPVMFEGNIQKLELSDLGKCFEKEESCDLVLGGPPCQGFSVHRIKGAGVDDPRNDLLHRYFDVVEYLAPKIFILENVPGILWSRHSSYLDLFYKKAESAGYRLKTPVVIDARDYGVPQRRKRVFILGISSQLPELENWPPTPTHGDPRKPLPKGILPWVPAKGAFSKAPKNDPNDIHMKHCEELITAFKKTPPNGGSRKDSGRLLPCHREHNGHKDVYGRIDPSLPGPTMTTACVNPSKGRFVHPTSHHGITVRQAARLQTFPDDFIFQGGIIAASKQIGNAVPVTLGMTVLSVIQDYLKDLPRNYD